MKRKELEKAIHDYFGQQFKELAVRDYGDIYDIDVTYEDGPSVNEARLDILAMSDNILNITVNRLYSRRAVSEALVALYEHDDSVAMRVESVLFAKNLACPVKDKRESN